MTMTENRKGSDLEMLLRMLCGAAFLAIVYIIGYSILHGGFRAKDGSWLSSHDEPFRFWLSRGALAFVGVFSLLICLRPKNRKA
jgi:hypothetical protein